ncbi:MAG: amidohydrolase [Clostridia bacterium]
MLLIKNARIYTMARKEKFEIIKKGHIFVKDGKIDKIITEDEKLDSFDKEKVRVINARGNIAMPGLIDAHSHIGIQEEKKGMEGNDSNETMEPVTPYLKAIDAVNAMDSAFENAVRAGITSVMTGPGSSNVVGGQFVFLKTRGRKIDDLIVLEPAAMKVAFGENPKRAYGDNGMMPSTRMTIASMLREELHEAVLYKQDKDKAMQNGEEFEEDFRMECWLPVLEKKIPLKAHVHRVDDILTAIRIAKQFDLDMTLDHCTEGHLIVDEILASGYPVIIGPTLASRNKIEVQYSDFKVPGVLAKKGIKVAITTDHPVSLITSLGLCAGLAAKEGLGVEEGLRAITINAAEICRVAHRVGSIEVGKDADIAIFSGNPMETFTKTLYTIIDGNVVYEAKR